MKMKPLNLLLLIVIVLIINDARSWQQSREAVTAPALSTNTVASVEHTGQRLAPPELFARASAH